MFKTLYKLRYTVNLSLFTFPLRNPRILPKYQRHSFYISHRKPHKYNEVLPKFTTAPPKTSPNDTSSNYSIATEKAIQGGRFPRYDSLIDRCAHSLLSSALPSNDQPSRAAVNHASMGREETCFFCQWRLDARKALAPLGKLFVKEKDVDIRRDFSSRVIR